MAAASAASIGWKPFARVKLLLKSEHDEVQVLGAELLKTCKGLEALPIAATPADPTRRPEDGDRPPTHLNEVTH